MFTPPRVAARKVTSFEAERAALALGLSPLSLVTQEDVRVGFRSAVREMHPDAGGDAAAAPERLKELTAARDTLLTWLAQAPDTTCQECHGTGFTLTTFAVKPCSRCG